MTAREQELEQRAEAAERRAAQLERRITELRREALLPCQVCQDAGSDASRRVSAEQWELLVDTLLLVEPIWERSKETRVECIRPNRENLDLDPVALVKKSSALIAELQDNLERCERLREAANEADSSLFSLFPFSAGTFKRAATFDLERMQATPARLSTADATTSASRAEPAEDALLESSPLRQPSASKLSRESYLPSSLMMPSLLSSRPLKSAWSFSGTGFFSSRSLTQDMKEQGGSSRGEDKDRYKVATARASHLMMEMAASLLDLRLEVNSYIQELVEHAAARDHALTVSRKDDAELQHQQQPHQQQPSQQRLEESVSKRHDQDHNQEVLMDDFLNESELEADAAEVEL